jgi:hypothetical protein
MKEENSVELPQSWSKDAVDYGLRTLVKCEASVANTIIKAREDAANPESPDHVPATELVARLEATKQVPPNRIIYDLRRNHHKLFLEIMLEEVGYGSWIRIMRDGEDIDRHRVIEHLEDKAYGKATQPIEVSGLVTHAEVAQLAAKEVAKLPDGEWVNPEDVVFEQQSQSPNSEDSDT